MLNPTTRILQALLLLPRHSQEIPPPPPPSSDTKRATGDPLVAKQPDSKNKTETKLKKCEKIQKTNSKENSKQFFLEKIHFLNLFTTLDKLHNC